jgi:large subunit ribosomal protein L11
MNSDWKFDWTKKEYNESLDEDTPYEKVGKISLKQLKEIAAIKMEDLNANSVEQAVSIIAGTARSMGVTVEG